MNNLFIGSTNHLNRNIKHVKKLNNDGGNSLFFKVKVKGVRNCSRINITANINRLKDNIN